MWHRLAHMLYHWMVMEGDVVLVHGPITLWLPFIDINTCAMSCGVGADGTLGHSVFLHLKCPQVRSLSQVTPRFRTPIISLSG